MTKVLVWQSFSGLPLGSVLLILERAQCLEYACIVCTKLRPSCLVKYSLKNIQTLKFATFVSLEIVSGNSLRLLSSICYR